MNNVQREKLLPVFFGVAACSWMPHWSCHYYRLETHSSFVVGQWNFSSFDSVIMLLVYGGLILVNLLSISIVKYRLLAAGISGAGHLAIGLLHTYRLLNPFNFQVFSYSWSYWATAREALIVMPFGLLCLFVAVKLD